MHYFCEFVAKMILISEYRKDFKVSVRLIPSF